MASFGVSIAKNHLLYTYVQSFAECEVMKVREIKHEISRLGAQNAHQVPMVAHSLYYINIYSLDSGKKGADISMESLVYSYVAIRTAFILLLHNIE